VRLGVRVSGSQSARDSELERRSSAYNYAAAYAACMHVCVVESYCVWIEVRVVQLRARFPPPRREGGGGSRVRESPL
jgi:hypothetical protein